MTLSTSNSWAVRIAVLGSGERLPLLVRGALALPDPDVTEFVLTRLRAKGLAANTINAYLHSVAAGLDFLGRRGISVEQRVSSGQYLSLQELRAFAAKCKRGARKLAVHPDEASGRYRRFVEYIIWRAMAQVGRASSELAFERARSAVRKFKARTEAVAPQPDRAIKSPDVTLGLSATQRDLLLQIIEPSDPRNPWRDPALRARNYVILRLDYELGPRAGDVLSLKVRDLNLTSLPPSVTFHRRHDDPEDPRARQPVLKTKPRVLYITNELADALADWIKTYRGDRTRFPASRRHPFLFVNKDGEPLGQRGYQRIFEKLRTQFPELKGIKSHSLRHDWNDRWVEMQGNSSNAADGTLREQCYAMGWSDRSSMPVRYSRRAVADSANNRILEMNSRAEGRGRRILSEGNKE